MVRKIRLALVMEERAFARIVLAHSGSTFDKDLINQSITQNYINGLNLFNNNTLNFPSNVQALTKIILLLQSCQALTQIL